MQLRGHEIHQFILVHLDSTILAWAFNEDLSSINTVFDVLVKAFKVIDMGAVQDDYFLWLHYLGTDSALVLCVIKTHENAFLRVICFFLVFEIVLIIKYL